MSQTSASAGARDWLAQHWSPQIDRSVWAELVVDGGWAALGWTQEWFGRGLGEADARAVEAEFAKVGAPGPGQDRFNLWAGTLLSVGSPELKRQFMRDLLLDRVAMCLLYSEPSAGSDLANLRTTAVLDGDEWVVNGQKVWTSGGHAADYGMLLARTDWDVPKHRGITFFWLPMRQPGVEVRPLRQATGDARFNEVFLTNAKVPDSHRLGEPGQGWMVLQTALGYERAVMGRSGAQSSGSVKREIATGATAKAFRDIPQPDLSLIDVACRAGLQHDPLVRQQLARLYCLRMVNQWNGQRAAAAADAGLASPALSLGKLSMSIMLHFAARVQGQLLGIQATLDGDGYPAARDANYSQLNAYFTSIGGGTDQIQRNIIGERVLGLPRVPDPQRDLPFRLAAGG